MSKTATGGAQVEVFMVARDRQQLWSEETTRFQGPNVVSCKVVTFTNIKRTPVIGSYLPPYTLEHLPDLEEALVLFQEHNTIVLREIIANIGQGHNLRTHQVSDLIMYFGLIDLLLHFLQNWRFQHTKTCYWVRQGIAMWARSA